MNDNHKQDRASASEPLSCPEHAPDSTHANAEVASLVDCESPAGREIIASVKSLYHQGLYLQALAASAPLGNLRKWRGTEARIMAGRLANNLGGSSLGLVSHYIAWRQAPKHFEARYFRALGIFGVRGPWPVLQFIRANELSGIGTEVDESDWLALKAHALGVLRDFDAADRAIDAALKLSPDRAWVLVEYASLLEMEDRAEEALAAIQRALAVRPFYRPAVQVAGHLYAQLNRDDEGLALLREASGKLESGDVLAQLAALETELQHYEEARGIYADLARFYPLMEKHKERDKWLLARQSDAAYYCGDFAAAQELARRSESPFHAKVAERMESEKELGRRVLLPVGFVRQHHVTCAPATLAAVSGYWRRPVDHLEIVVEICYDGTPGHQERRWAEEQGFHAREFRVTLECAVALIDRGCPFTLTTVGSAAGHLQAVIGFDTLRGTLLVRDPSQRHWTEFLGAEMVEFFRSSGPRGMVLIPQEQAQEALAGLDLPEADLYDASYELDRALENHKREEAKAIHQRMREVDPNHRLTLHSRCVLARYDADTVSLLQTTEQLLTQYPDDVNLLLGKLDCLRELGRKEERLAFLKDLTTKKPDAVIFQNYALELAEDMRFAEEAKLYACKAMRWRPQDGRNYSLLADLAWGAGNREQALEFYRVAACLDDKDEARNRSYFLACRSVRQTEQALDFLKQRYTRLGRQSSWPGRTLAWAYEQVELPAEAFAVVEEARRLRPDDGELALYAADMVSRYGNYSFGQEILESCREKTHRSRWLRTAARLANYRGELQAALRCWHDVLESEPLARDAHDRVASLLGDLEGEEAALAHLNQIVQQFPHSVSLRTLLVERLGAGQPEATEAAIRKLLERNAVDPWARRELAISLFRQRRWEESLAELEIAERIEPGSPVVSFVEARVFLAQNRVSEAMEKCRQALLRSVDYEPAIDTLVEIARTKAEREESLRFVHEQLVAQVIHGDGLLTFRERAGETFEPQELLAMLREALAARPDLWHAWSSVIRELVHREQVDEAYALARQAVERFPLLPRMWLDLAIVCRARDDATGEREALVKTVEINPSWGEAVRRLAEFHLIANEPLLARAVLERALASEPRDVQLMVSLAKVLRTLDANDLAMEKLQHAVRLEPGYDYGWNTLREFAKELGKPEVPLAEARRLSQTRPHEARSWYRLADILEAPESRDECLAALDRAIELNPLFDDAHGLRCWYLADSGRYDEALAACQPAAYQGNIPVALKARAADVEMGRGNASEAIAIMRGLVRDDCDYYYAWYRLACWYRDSEQKPEYIEAAGQLVRLAPSQAMSYGYRAEARSWMDDREGAKLDLAKALQLDPAYTFASLMLSDMHIAESNGSLAISVLEKAKATLPLEWYGAGIVCANALILADDAKRKEQLVALCRAPMENAEPLSKALRALKEIKAGKWVLFTLSEELRLPEASVHLIGPFLDMCLADCEFTLATQILDFLQTRPELWNEAAAHWVYGLAIHGYKVAFLAFVLKDRRLLEMDHRAWYSVANGYLIIGAYHDVIHWCANWRTRANLPPRWLGPLALAYWSLAKRRDAVEVSQAALELESPDGISQHLVWLAVHRLMDGDWQAARDLLAKVDLRDVSSLEARLGKALGPVCEAFSALAHDRRAVKVEKILAEFSKALTEDWEIECVRRVYYSLSAALHKAAGNWLRSLWYRIA